MKIEEKLHDPVMPNEVLEHVKPKEGGVYVDCTFGNGGHSDLILKKLNDRGTLVGFDLDKESLQLVQNLENFKEKKNLVLINDNFSNLKSCLEKMNIKKADFFLFDLGISSYQLLNKERGFSYKLDSPLDMRINRASGKNAFHVINNYSQENLSDIFYLLGEERKSRVISRKICLAREKKEIKTTQDLVGIVASSFQKKTKKHPARKVFQSLRIFVNSELDNISKALKDIFEHDLLDKGGRIVVISFHSLEDRIIKNIFKENFLSGRFKLITKKPLIPSDEEVEKNNRSRSAKMRIIEKI
jgi:16S rRNA (cytosine1402-N4)-methyltransferase